MLPRNARFIALSALGIVLSAAVCAQPSPQANAGFDAYVHTIEARLDQQHRSPDAFLASVALPDAATRLRNGESLIERLSPAEGPELPGALLFHWRGTTFVPGGKAADFEHLLRDFDSYPKSFSPQVLRAAVLSLNGDQLKARMRVRQHHVITVVLDTTYDVTFGHLDTRHGYSLSRSTEISEIESAGTPAEQTLSPEKSHGFMWRLNTYWTWVERDHGLYLQIESVSLTRSIPAGLAWAVRPFVESIPRESVEFTLDSAARALGKKPVASAPSNKPAPKP